MDNLRWDCGVQIKRSVPKIKNILTRLKSLRNATQVYKRASISRDWSDQVVQNEHFNGIYKSNEIFKIGVLFFILLV